MYWWNIYFIAAIVFFVFFFFGYSWMAYGLSPVEAIVFKPMLFLSAFFPALFWLAGLMRNS